MIKRGLIKHGEIWTNKIKYSQHKSTWSYENRVSKHFVIFLNFPCLIACLLCYWLMSYFFGLVTLYLKSCLSYSDPMKPRKKPFSHLVINPCYITPCFINPCFINPVHVLLIQSSPCFITCPRRWILKSLFSRARSREGISVSLEPNLYADYSTRPLIPSATQLSEISFVLNSLLCIWSCYF